MKHYKTVEVPETTEQVLERTTCDLCGGEISEGSYEVNEVEIRHKTGNCYPETGFGEEVRVDMCGECFTEKLTPWLVAQGVKVTEVEWDY